MQGFIPMQKVATEAAQVIKANCLCTDVLVIVVNRLTGEHQIASGTGTVDDSILVCQRTIEALHNVKQQQGQKPKWKPLADGVEV